MTNIGAFWRDPFTNNKTTMKALKPQITNGNIFKANVNGFEILFMEPPSAAASTTQL
jgi:hypothetical protein